MLFWQWRYYNATSSTSIKSIAITFVGVCCYCWLFTRQEKHCRVHIIHVLLEIIQAGLQAFFLIIRAPCICFIDIYQNWFIRIYFLYNISCSLTRKWFSNELFTTEIHSDKSILINIKKADAWGLSGEF